MTLAATIDGQRPGFIGELCIALAHRWDPERLFVIFTAYIDEAALLRVARASFDSWQSRMVATGARPGCLAGRH